jgi:predicted dehydrogenase
MKDQSNMTPLQTLSVEKPIRLGLVGCGGICRGAHAPVYRNDPRVEVVALCDILPERTATLLRDCFPAAQAYTDYRELLARPDIDAIDICTPNHLHSEVAIAAFQAGKHVMCEKPDAIDPGKAEAMKAAAEQAGKLLMVMRNNRFSDASKMARRFITAGKMGEIYAARCGWQRRRGIPGRGGWFTTRAQSGGGPLIDLGVHMIDLAVWLMGNPRPVTVSGNTYRKFADDRAASDSEHAQFGDRVADGTFDVEDLAMGLIRFENGALLQIEFSWASNVKAESRFVELRGTRAGLEWRDGALEIFSESDGQLVDLKPAGRLIEDGHARNLVNFIEVLLGQAEPCYQPQQGVDMIRILDALYRSARSGAEIRI